MTDKALSDHSAAIAALTHEVGPDIVGAAASASLAVIQHARSIATFVEEHAARGIKLEFGLQALELTGEALQAQIKAREKSLRARAAFYRAAKTAAPEIGYGPWCPCDPPHQPGQPKEQGVSSEVPA